MNKRHIEPNSPSVILPQNWVKTDLPFREPIPVVMTGSADSYFIHHHLKEEMLYHKVNEREQQKDRPKIVVEEKIKDMLSETRISTAPSFLIGSCFRADPDTIMESVGKETNFMEIASSLYRAGLFQDFFTLEEAHHVAALLMQHDEICRRDSPVLIFYKIPGHSIIYILWIFRNSVNQLHVCDLQYYTIGFKLPISTRVFTKDNVFILVPEEEQRKEDSA